MVEVLFGLEEKYIRSNSKKNVTELLGRFFNMGLSKEFLEETIPSQLKIKSML